MKRYIATGFIIALMASHAPARIGETPQQLQQRYGVPVKQAFADGEGICIYHADGLKEIRVHFSEGQSDQEDSVIYLEPASFEAKTDLVKRVQSENPDQHVENREDRVRVSSNARLQGLSNRGSGNPFEERSYSGVAKVKSYDLGEVAVLNDNGTLIEMPPRIRGFEAKPGHSYTVTVLPNSTGDLSAPSVVVSKREHVDLADSTEDGAVHGGPQQLVRITEGDKVIFDRSICSLHDIKMEKRNCEIRYGLPPPSSKAESYCIDHFPNCRDHAVGGCVFNDESPKSAVIYICPKCVAECNEYKRQHPEKPGE